MPARYALCYLFLLFLSPAFSQAEDNRGINVIAVGGDDLSKLGDSTF
ncbi:MAG: hypothetical protein O3B01_15990 [Planctomycetota bacterium]|nr:hypothetical protein [Planctomycetota bacterium]MDA1140075.1 hypothetical protein [Planctomycetota bacterium]